jgi:ribose/xylose/arabinose/galactoside ABC-type transport system permease subunit
MMMLMIAGVFDPLGRVGDLDGRRRDRRLLMNYRWPVFPAVVAGVALAALAGWVNGMLVARPG